MTGRVVSAKLKNTVTVLIERTAMHPLYKKTYLRSKKFQVDDNLGCKEGDIVEIVKIKPVSKNKHWKVVKIVGKNLEEIIEAKQKETAEKVIAEVMPEDDKGEGESGKGKETKKENIEITKTNKEKNRKENKHEVKG